MGWRVAQSALGNGLCVARLPFPMKTIIVGLGNPIPGDDGVGWKVAEEVKKKLTSNQPVAIEFLSLGGLSLMEHLIGYDRAILIDAVMSNEEICSVTVSELSEMPDASAFHITSAHDMSLQNALKLGKAMGAALPEQVTVVGIATNHVYDFGEELSLPGPKQFPKPPKLSLNCCENIIVH